MKIYSVETYIKGCIETPYSGPSNEEAVKVYNSIKDNTPKALTVTECIVKTDNNPTW